ncbi:RRP15-like protein isoform 2-T2 [Leptodactylus fuscus]|uniref:RRP15-like protein isoform X2 n=1 Tax=Leptodactylus fuscus TaxID=238119 RepID=UPI003F4E9872
MEVRAAAEQEQSEPAGSDVSDFGDDSFSSDGGDQSDASNHDSSDHEDDDPNKGWADAMAKILNKKVPSDKATTILVKSKALEKEKEKDRQERLEKKKQFDKKRQWEMMCRVKPDVVKDREAERNLQRTATRGVVQLFNAVKTHQGNINDKMKEVGHSERKKSKLMSSVSKKDFINVLRGKEGQEETGERPRGKKAAAKTQNTSEWNILRDDFMMGASMKDWDKDSDDGGKDTKPGANSGSDSDR